MHQDEIKRRLDAIKERIANAVQVVALINELKQTKDKEN